MGAIHAIKQLRRRLPPVRRSKYCRELRQQLTAAQRSLDAERAKNAASRRVSDRLHAIIAQQRYDLQELRSELRRRQEQEQTVPPFCVPATSPAEATACQCSHDTAPLTPSDWLDRVATVGEHARDLAEECPACWDAGLASCDRCAVVWHLGRLLRDLASGYTGQREQEEHHATARRD